MFEQIGKVDVTFDLVEKKMSHPNYGNIFVEYWELFDVRRIMQETKDEYERELARLKKDK